MLYAQWRARYQQALETSKDRRPVPPAMIVVCENTDLARVFYEKISGEASDEDGNVARVPSQFPDLANTETERHTFRIDTKLLAKAEGEEGESHDQAAQALRELVNSVGVRGKPGEQVRCVVSVSMLTEGWDANNVTHILGLRPFRSQLLCEQVVGRGLRRTSYTPDPVTGLLPPEYVDVYGIPFSLIPFKGKSPKPEGETDPVYHHIHALPERESFEIRVPVVEGYTYALKRGGIRCDVASMEELVLDEDPTTVYLAVTRGYAEGTMGRSPEEFIAQDRQEFYLTVRLQQIVFGIARDIVSALEAGQGSGRVALARQELFPEVVKILEEYVTTRVRAAPGVDLREIAHHKHVTRIRSMLLDAIQPAAASEEAPLVPLLNRFKPWLSTRDVSERTTRPVVSLEKSHLNYATIMSTDEEYAIRYLESSPLVECFVANTRHLGLQIAYEYQDNQRVYIPDFIVRLRPADGGEPRTLVLEIKGGGGERDPNEVAAKTTAAQKWVKAVSNLGRNGRWEFRICRELVRLPLILSECAGEKPERLFPWEEVPAEERSPWGNCLPLTSLKAAAGSWSREQASFEDMAEWAETWVKPNENFDLEKGMFIAQVQGDSMVPLIPNGAWCVFRPVPGGSREGRVLLVWHSGISDPHTGGQYTVKQYHSEKLSDAEHEWHHLRIVLKPRNPAYDPIVLEPQDEGEVKQIAEFVKVLGP
jgi:type III restriction enzyme